MIILVQKTFKDGVMPEEVAWTTTFFLQKVRGVNGK